MNLAFYTQYPGLLATWTIDLSAYQEETIYIGFLHNSDDDNFIALDDILVTGTAGVPDTTGGGGPGPVGVEAPFSTESMHLFPTVVDDVLHVSFSGNYERQEKISVFDMAGKLLMDHFCLGSQSEHLINVSNLEPGIYLIGVDSENGWITNKFLKK